MDIDAPLRDRALSRRSFLGGAASLAGLAVLGTGSLGALAACSSSSSGSGDSAGVTDKTITIGIDSTNSGPFPSTGQQFCGYFQRAMAAVNKTGGVHGRTIKVTVLDDGGDAQRALSNVRQLVTRDKVFALTGLGTGTTSAYLDYIDQQNVPLVFSAALLDNLIAPPKKNVYGIFPMYPAQATAICNWAFSSLGKPTRVAIVRASVPVFDNTVKAATAAVNRAGGKVVTTLNSTYDQPEWGSIVLQLKRAKPDYVILVSSAPAMGALFKVMVAQQALPAKGVLGIATVVDQGFINAAGDIPNNTVYGAVPGIVVPTSPHAAAVRDLWPGETLGIYGLQGAAAAYTLVEALKRLGDKPTRGGLEKLLASDFGPFNLPYTGTIKSTSNHMMQNVISIATLKDGKPATATDGFVKA